MLGKRSDAERVSMKTVMKEDVHAAKT